MSTTGVTTRYLPLLLTTTTETLIQVRKDENRRTTAPVIPGRTLQGVFAVALRDRPALLMEHAVRGKGITVGPAYPIAVDGSIAIPTPASWIVLERARKHRSPLVNRRKERSTLQDLLDPYAVRDGRASSLDPLVTFDEKNVKPYRPRTTVNSRGGTVNRDSRTVTAASGPFVDILLDANQRFLTLWRLRYSTEQERDTLLTVVSECVCTASANGRLTLGGAGRAAGGGPVFTARDGRTTVLTPDHLIRPSEASALWAPQPDDPTSAVWLEGKSRTVHALSPVVPMAGASAGQESLASLLVAAAKAATGTDCFAPESEWVTPVRHGGYNRLYSGFVAVTWAAGPGSTARLKALRDVTAQEIDAWIGAGVGIRQAEGCGRFALAPTLQTTYAPSRHRDAKAVLVDGFGREISARRFPVSDLLNGTDTAVVQLQDRLFRSVAVDHARDLGSVWPGPDPAAGPSAHLWSSLLTRLLTWRAAGCAFGGSLKKLIELLEDKDGLPQQARESLAVPVVVKKGQGPVKDGSLKAITIVKSIAAADVSKWRPPAADDQQRIPTFLTPLVKPLAARALVGWKDDSGDLDRETVATYWLARHRDEYAFEALVAYLRAQRARAKEARQNAAEEASA